MIMYFLQDKSKYRETVWCNPLKAPLVQDDFEPVILSFLEWEVEKRLSINLQDQHDKL